MRNFKSKIPLTMAIGACLAFGAAASQTVYDQQAIADTYASGTYLDISASQSFEWAHISVVGPNGYELNKVIDSGAANIAIDLVFDPAQLVDPYQATADIGLSGLPADGGLADGGYHYEITFNHADGTASRANGGFRVEGGAAVAPEPRRQEPRADEAQGHVHEPGSFDRIARAFLDILIPSANAQSLSADEFVQINSEDNLSRLNLMEEGGTVNANTWRLWNESSSSPTFQIVEGLNTPRLTIRQGGRIGIGTAVPNSRLHIDSGSTENPLRVQVSGLTSLVTFSHRGTGIGNLYTASTVPDRGLRVFGRTVLDSELAINAANPEIQLNRTSIGTNWYIRNSLNDFVVRQVGGGNGTANRLVIQSGGNVGLGYSNPEAALHVRRTDGTSEILVEETQFTEVNRQLLLRSNGNTGFVMQNSSNSRDWEFRTGGQGGSSNVFLINYADQAGPELRLTAGGNLFVKGTVSGRSSRESKTNINRVDTDQAIKNLRKLELHEWSYIADTQSRHLGPMAEDFHQLFSYGHGPTEIAPSDLASLALVSAQHLLEENQAILEQNEKLRARLEQIEARLGDI